MPPADYLVTWVRAMQRGWRVDFGSEAAVGWPSQHVSVPASRLVLGFSRGTPNGHSIFIDPEDVGKAWAALAAHERPRGVMFWNMMNDGGTCWRTDNTTTTMSFAREFNRFLHVR